MEPLLGAIISALAGGCLLAFALCVLIFGTAADGGSHFLAFVFSAAFCSYPALWLARRIIKQTPSARYVAPFAMVIPPAYIAFGLIGNMNWTSSCAVAAIAPITLAALWAARK